MVETWVFWIIGIGLVSIALLAAGWYYWRKRKQVKSPAMDARTVNRMREVMDEFSVYTDVHLHRNRNGKVAIAFGEPPEIWPEDMRVPDDQD